MFYLFLLKQVKKERRRWLNNEKISIIGSIIILFTIFACIALSSGGNANTLYLLNWGEYINQELITKFEQEYNAIVIEETVTSSETMYQK